MQAHNLTTLQIRQLPAKIPNLTQWRDQLVCCRICAYHLPHLPQLQLPSAVLLYWKQKYGLVEMYKNILIISELIYPPQHSSYRAYGKYPPRKIIRFYDITNWEEVTIPTPDNEQLPTPCSIRPSNPAQAKPITPPHVSRKTQETLGHRVPIAAMLEKALQR